MEKTSEKKRILLILTILVVAFLVTAILVAAFSLTLVFSQALASNRVNPNLDRIACLGDSITEISGYPEDLQALLGNTSVVGNFGVTASTINWYGSKPYQFEPTFRQSARNFTATTVIIMLGTNDARSNLYAGIVNFTGYYESLVNRTLRWNSTKQIFLVVPPPIFDNNLELNGTFFVQEVIPRIYQVAKNMSLPVIDVYTPLRNHPEYFIDGVHPNPEGAKVIANIIYKNIK